MLPSDLRSKALRSASPSFPTESPLRSCGDHLLLHLTSTAAGVSAEQSSASSEESRSQDHSKQLDQQSHLQGGPLQSDDQSNPIFSNNNNNNINNESNYHIRPSFLDLPLTTPFSPAGGFDMEDYEEDDEDIENELEYTNEQQMQANVNNNNLSIIGTLSAGLSASPSCTRRPNNNCDNDYDDEFFADSNKFQASHIQTTPSGPSLCSGFKEKQHLLKSQKLRLASKLKSAWQQQDGNNAHSNSADDSKANQLASRAALPSDSTGELTKKKTAGEYLFDLPSQILFQICAFIQPQEIHTVLARVSQEFKTFTNDTRLWNHLAKFTKLRIADIYRKTHTLVERRSKGKLFHALSRLNNEHYMVRTINVIVSNAGHDDGLPTSILRELSYLKVLDHVNISKIEHVEVKNSSVQIVSKRGEYNLKEYLKSKQSSPSLSAIDPITQLPQASSSTTKVRTNVSIIKQVFFDILNGINYLHHNGILHRNLKIDNIIVDGDQPRIADFGLSRLVTIPHIPYTPEDPKERERSGREARRLWYRAPELLLRKCLYSFEVDIWSLGCLLAEITLNEPLFTGDSEIEQLFKIFKLLGSPDAETLSNMCEGSEYRSTFPKWEKINLSDICQPHSSSNFKEIKAQMIPNRQSGFLKLKDLGAVLGIQGTDLLGKMLQLNPQSRITAQDAINHPFFDEIREKQLQVSLLKQPTSQATTTRSSSHLNCSSCKVPRVTLQNAHLKSQTPLCSIAQMYSTMRQNEEKVQVTPKLLPSSMLQQQHPSNSAVTENMKVILIDWLTDVSIHFEVQQETLHYCAAYLNRFMSLKGIDRQKFQLLGVCCLKIADIYNEKSREYYKQENSVEYAYITAEEYTAAELITMEKEVLEVLDFDLYLPNTMYFTKIICNLLGTNENVTLTAMFLCDLLLLSSASEKFASSMLASACVFLSFLTHEGEFETLVEENGAQWPHACAILDHYKREDFKNCVDFVRKFWMFFSSDPSTLHFESVFNKYNTLYNANQRNLVCPPISYPDIARWVYSS